MKFFYLKKTQKGLDAVMEHVILPNKSISAVKESRNRLTLIANH